LAIGAWADLGDERSMGRAGVDQFFVAITGLTASLAIADGSEQHLPSGKYGLIVPGPIQLFRKRAGRGLSLASRKLQKCAAGGVRRRTRNLDAGGIDVKTPFTRDGTVRSATTRLRKGGADGETPGRASDASVHWIVLKDRKRSLVTWDFFCCWSAGGLRF